MGTHSLERVMAGLDPAVSARVDARRKAEHRGY